MTNITAPKTVTIDEAEQIVAAGSHQIFDVNSEERYAKGHLPGAVRLGDRELSDVLPSDTSTALVFYCGSSSCSAAPNVAAKAVELGYTDVSVLTAGISGWEFAGRPVETVSA